METTKQDFGRFVADHRRGAGLTQRELASRLHVTESAVSKWERGRSYPDITVVPILAQALGVSSDELMNASEDPEARFERRDARSYRAWRSALLWSTSIAYAVTLLTTFIVNLSASHTLSWFWIVLPAVALAFSLTTLPMLRIPARGWIVLGSSTLSLFVLFGAAAIAGGSGTWVPIAVAAVLLAVVIVFGPIWLVRADLPDPFGHHVTALSLLLDTIALALFLLALFISIGRADLWASPALVIGAIGVAPVWVIALILRYLPARALFGAAISIAFIGVYSFFIDDAVSRVLGVPPQPRAFDLTQWANPYLAGNIAALNVVGCFAIATVLVAIGLVLGRRGSESGSGPRGDAPAFASPAA